MRLYEFVFANTTANQLKKRTFTQEEARTAEPLANALQISYNVVEERENLDSTPGEKEAERAGTPGAPQSELREMDDIDNDEMENDEMEI